MWTLLAQPGPPQLAVAFGDLLADALQHRTLASSEGRPRPMAVPERTFGHPLYGLTWEHPLLRASAGSGLAPILVPKGNGAPMGLSQHEHFSWARPQGYSADDISAQVDQEVRRAVHYELTHDTEDIDEERRALARLWIDLARAVQEGEPQRLPDARSPLALSCCVLLILWYIFWRKK